jgi:NAD(P)H-hydrate epimerase
MRVLSAEAMRELDRRAIEEVGIPSLVLMENAALGLVEAVADLGEAVEAVAIFCGPGNNGGDGLALARHLDARGYAVEVFLATFGRGLAGDPATQLRICRHQGVVVEELAGESDLPGALARAGGVDLVVDALFGTGLSRPLSGPYEQLVAGLNALAVPLLAVDLPSGLHGTRTELEGVAVDADLTVTLAAPKRSAVLGTTAERVGELVVADLGIPPVLLAELPEPEGRLSLLVPEELAGHLPERPAAAHKGNFGHVVVVAGSPGKAGAVVLALQSAVRAGAGLVTAAVPAPLLPVVDLGSLESMTVALPAGEEGLLAPGCLEPARELLAGKDAWALGPGAGGGEAVAGLLRRLALEVPLPLVLDADGLNAFAGRAAELRARPAPTVLTPHPGELGRLLGTTAAAVQEDRLAAVRAAVEATGAVVVLKGHRTLVGAPGNPGVDVWVCLAGNPGMATGGSGDVLTGLILGLLPQVGDALTAARLGVFLHGRAGDLAAADRGPEALAAGDLVAALPGAFRSLREVR